MTRSKLAWLGSGTAVVVAGVVTAVLLAGAGGREKTEGVTPPPAGDESAIAVNTIKPRLDPSFVVSVEEPAYVEAYYRADLEARQAGVVKYIRADIGDPVTKGEALVEVDVPDVVQNVALKEAEVARARTELDIARMMVPVAERAVDVAHATVEQRRKDLGKAQAEVKLNKLRLNRVRVMVSRQALFEDVQDERNREYEASVAGYESAQAAVQKADADWKEAQAKLEAAKADLKLKQAMIDVARKARDLAQALADYAKVVAPFDGVVTRRNVDPGSFVQNATTGHTEPLLTIERTDVVTVAAKVPDTYAPYITADTEAVLEMTELPGRLIRGKVTRFSPSLHESDRRMRVEVDLFNGDAAQYQAFLAKARATKGAGLKGGALPLLPQVTAKAGQPPAAHLLPGMFGTMRLALQRFQKAYLIPSGTVIRQNGKPYIYTVSADGLAHPVAVDVQVDDGKEAMVLLVTRVGGHEERDGLSGTEEIVASNQAELSEGQPVRAHRVDW